MLNSVIMKTWEAIDSRPLFKASDSRLIPQTMPSRFIFLQRESRRYPIPERRKIKSPIYFRFLVVLCFVWKSLAKTVDMINIVSAA